MTALMYHDIVLPGADDGSGFPGRDAARYKLTAEAFDEHLLALSGMPAPPVLTFDDGGISARMTADRLEAHGFRGTFLVTTNYIGIKGFVDAAAICELRRRGHVIGSHSCSHPLRMGHCTREHLLVEWTRSRSALADVLGEEIAVASVPGGDFTPHVAAAAADAGYSRLYTSEPSNGVVRLGTMTIVGRYTIFRGTTARQAAAFARGDRLTCLTQRISWQAKKVSKMIGGAHYLKLRRCLLGASDEVRWGPS